MTARTPKPARASVKLPGTVHDGNGGFFPVGHPLDADAATLASLKAKGLVE